VIAFTISGRPVSVNHLYFTAPHGRRVTTKAGRAFKEHVRLLAQIAMRKANISEPTTGGVALYVRFFFETRRGDVDNAVKALMDSMTGIVYKDDGQVLELHAWKDKDKDNPRTQVHITGDLHDFKP
jgi:crossover junction endodeoxyribonuclease RusA